MALMPYLAMTASEILETGIVPEKLALISDPDSLDRLPGWIPAETVLLLTDETALGQEHLDALQRLTEAGRVSEVILDFQKPGDEITEDFTRLALKTLRCPVCVSQQYGQGLECPVLLPPAPPDESLEEYLLPWAGRGVWLEGALEKMKVTVTEGGAVSTPPRPWTGEKIGFRDENLCCHYSYSVTDKAEFCLWRTGEDLKRLLEKAEGEEFCRMICLFQEVGEIFLDNLP